MLIFLVGVFTGVVVTALVEICLCKSDLVCDWWNWLFRIEEIIDGKRYSTYGAAVRYGIYYKTSKGQWFTAYRGPGGEQFELERVEDVRLRLTEMSAKKDDEKLRQLLRDEFGEAAPAVVAG